MNGLKKIVTTLLICSATLPAMLSGQSYYNFKPMPNSSTKGANEACPVVVKNGLVFNSDKDQGGIQRRTGMNQQKISHLYFMERKEDGSYGSPVLFSKELTTEHNEGPISFNFNEDLAVFTRNYELPVFGNKKGGNPNMGLFFARYNGNRWTDITEFEHNDRAFDFIHPSISPMGDLLFFASDKPGGFGGFDLYSSSFVNGSWTVPVNLGPSVNTASNELYPFLHATGRLYFSSNGHDQTGGYDIFYTEPFKGKWFTPVKLPAPFNTAQNDFTYYSNEDFSEGFFTRSRRGSIDIFSFNLTLPQFELCKKQVENNYCYVFFEENTVSLDTSLYVYEWNMGDGKKVMSTEAEHCYAGPGDYLVELNVVDRLTGIVEFNQAEYLVEVRKIIQPYITGPDTIRVNQQVQFHGTESFLGTAVAGEFYWDFGDGLKEVGAAVRHTYQTPGQYTLKLGIVEENPDPVTTREFCSYKTVIVTE